MIDHPLVPCLWMDSEAQEAAAFYTQTFPDGHITAVSRYPEAFDNPSQKPRGSVMTVEFEIGGQRFTALNGGPLFKMNPSISFFVHVGSADEADRLYAALSEGGEALMPLGSYPWSERYAWVKDRFGVSWQIISGRRPEGGAMIVPCLMFSGPQHNKAEEAMKLYTSIFPGGRIDSVERYAAGEGPEGSVKHGRFRICGREIVAMDSHLAHDHTFNEAVSIQVMCEAQAEIDRYWEALSEGGEKGPCGWLKDRFGLSFQVVPASIGEWLTSEDSAAKARAFKAMMAMKKPDISALQSAFSGQ